MKNRKLLTNRTFGTFIDSVLASISSCAFCSTGIVNGSISKLLFQVTSLYAGAGDAIGLCDRRRLARRGGDAVGGQRLRRREPPRTVDQRAHADADRVRVANLDDLLLARADE